MSEYYDQFHRWEALAEFHFNINDELELNDDNLIYCLCSRVFIRDFVKTYYDEEAASETDQELIKKSHEQELEDHSHVHFSDDTCYKVKCDKDEGASCYGSASHTENYCSTDEHDPAQVHYAIPHALQPSDSGADLTYQDSHFDFAIQEKLDKMEQDLPSQTLENTNENYLSEESWDKFWAINGERLIWDSWITKYSDYINPSYLDENNDLMMDDNNIPKPKSSDNIKVEELNENETGDDQIRERKYSYDSKVNSYKKPQCTPNPKDPIVKNNESAVYKDERWLPVARRRSCSEHDRMLSPRTITGTDSMTNVTKMTISSLDVTSSHVTSVSTPTDTYSVSSTSSEDQSNDKTRIANVEEVLEEALEQVPLEELDTEQYWQFLWKKHFGEQYALHFANYTEKKQNICSDVKENKPSTDLKEELDVHQSKPSTDVTEDLHVHQSKPSTDVTEDLDVNQHKPSTDLKEELDVHQSKPSIDVTEDLHIHQSKPSTEVTDDLDVHQRKPSTEVTEDLDVHQSKPSADVTEYLDVHQCKPSTDVTEDLDVHQRKPTTDITEDLDVHQRKPSTDVIDDLDVHQSKLRTDVTEDFPQSDKNTNTQMKSTEMSIIQAESFKNQVDNLQLVDKVKEDKPNKQKRKNKKTSTRYIGSVGLLLQNLLKDKQDGGMNSIFDEDVSSNCGYEGNRIVDADEGLNSKNDQKVDVESTPVDDVDGVLQTSNSQEIINNCSNASNDNNDDDEPPEEKQVTLKRSHEQDGEEDDEQERINSTFKIMGFSVGSNKMPKGEIVYRNHHRRLRAPRQKRFSSAKKTYFDDDGNPCEYENQDSGSQGEKELQTDDDCKGTPNISLVDESVQKEASVLTEQDSPPINDEEKTHKNTALEASNVALPADSDDSPDVADCEDVTVKTVSDEVPTYQTEVKRKRKQKQKRKVEGTTDVSDMPEELKDDPKMKKYWKKRHSLFHRFDEGIQLDRESWFSVTPENVAWHIANKYVYDVVLDAFCGAGGNTIQFARVSKKVIAIDIDPAKIEMAKHNASIYGVADRVEFIVGDFFELAPTLTADMVFLSPPWGGPKYSENFEYDLETMLIPKPASELMAVARTISSSISLYLPRNTNTDQILSLAKQACCSVEVEQSYLDRRFVAITAYFYE